MSDKKFALTLGVALGAAALVMLFMAAYSSKQRIDEIDARGYLHVDVEVRPNATPVPTATLPGCLDVETPGVVCMMPTATLPTCFTQSPYLSKCVYRGYYEPTPTQPATATPTAVTPPTPNV